MVEKVGNYFWGNKRIVKVEHCWQGSGALCVVYAKLIRLTKYFFWTWALYSIQTDGIGSYTFGENIPVLYSFRVKRKYEFRICLRASCSSFLAFGDWFLNSVSLIN